MFFDKLVMSEKKIAAKYKSLKLHVSNMYDLLYQELRSLSIKANQKVSYTWGKMLKDGRFFIEQHKHKSLFDVFTKRIEEFFTPYNKVFHCIIIEISSKHFYFSSQIQPIQSRKGGI